MSGAAAGETTEFVLELSEPRSRILVRAPSGRLGRAEARFGGKSWSAKHYWTEGDASAGVTVYELDEPIPAGRTVLHIPISI